MIRNIIIHNILYIIEISKSIKSNKCIHKEKFMKMFPMIFQISMGPRKSRCGVPSGTTQGWACPFLRLSLLSNIFPIPTSCAKTPFNTTFFCP